MGGPSQAAINNEKAQTAFYQQVTGQQAQAFSEQQNILQDIQSVVQPIVNAGPNAYGFTPQEDALLKSQIETQGAQATANAQNAAQLAEKQASGGAAILPTGATEQINANLNLLGEQNTANQLTSEELAGWNFGNQRYLEAENALSGNASLISPTSYTNAATGAGAGATGAINLADSERSNLLSSILGGVVGALGGPNSLFTGFLSGEAGQSSGGDPNSGGGFALGGISPEGVGNILDTLGPVAAG